MRNTEDKKRAGTAGKAETEVKERRIAFCNRYALLLHLVLSYAGYFLIEAMSRHSFVSAWTFVDQRTKVFFYNGFLIFVTTLPAFLMRKRSFYRVFIAALWLSLGLANGIVLSNRVTPLTGPDLGMIREAYRVAGKYFPKPVALIVIILALIGIAALVRYAIVSPKYRGEMHWRVAIPGVIGAFAALFGFTMWGLSSRQLSSYFSNIAFAYQDYGFPYAFLVTIFDTGISEPNGYSEELVDSIVSSEGDLPETEVTDDMPNIVIVQLESFFDPSRVKRLKMSGDPLENWHELAKQYSSGYYTVPTVGAGTVNTEFETLTGMSLRFFGAGEYPYKSILRKETCESIAYDLEALGYTTHAIHNNESNFYGRRKVYSYLGFNSFTSAEYMDTQDDVNENGWMRDENLIPCVTDALDSTSNRDLVFTVTVQPHGAYPTEPVIDDPEITVSGMESEEKNNQWEYYVNQINEEDQFVADLISTLEERDEPTICLFYGDHLPTLGLSDIDLKTGTTFDTNYLIWDNLGLKRTTRKMRAYQAASELFGKIGIHTGTMFRFHQTMKNSENYLADMQILQYDMLYGKRYVYGTANPFSRSVLALGVKPIRVNRIVKMTSDGSYYIEGQNFTQSCVFELNGEVQDTTFVTNTTLLVRNVSIEHGDWVDVAVKSNSSTGAILSTSNTFVYGAGNLTDLDPEESTRSQGESLSGAENNA